MAEKKTPVVEKKGEEIPTERDPNVTDADVMRFPSRVEITEGEEEPGRGEEREPSVTKKDDKPGGEKTDDLTDIEIGGTTYRVSKDAATAFMGELSKVVTTRRSTPREESLSTSDRKPTKLEELTKRAKKDLFLDPEKFIGELTGAIREQVVSEVSSAYVGDQTQQRFWNDFYNDNPQLKKARPIVQAVLQENFDDLADLPTAAAAKKLASMTQERIMNFAKDFGFEQVKRPVNKKAAVEGANQSRGSSEREEPEKVVTLSQTIRKRQLERMQRRRATVA